VRFDARIITSTYNEPLITSEWAVEVFKEAKGKGLVTSYVSNGNGTPEVVEFLRPWLDLCKVDLKGFSEKRYRQLGAVLQHTLDTIKLLHEKGFWVEIVTLVVPGFNDSEEELRDIARFIAGVSPDIPWHVTAFHPDYKMTDRRSTSVASLTRAAGIGKKEGLRFVYAGNRPGSRRTWRTHTAPAAAHSWSNASASACSRTTSRTAPAPGAHRHPRPVVEAGGTPAGLDSTAPTHHIQSLWITWLRSRG